MNQLIAVAFPGDRLRAFDLRARFVSMSKAHLVELEDAVVVVCDSNGKIKLDQMHDLTAEGAVSGAFWGVLIGTLFSLPLIGPGAFAVPLVGLSVGAGTGAVGGYLQDIGIDDGFIKEVSQAMVPGSSALFVLVRQNAPEKVREHLDGYGGQVLTTNLSDAAEARLQQILNPGRRPATERAATERRVPAEAPTTVPA